MNTYIFSIPLECGSHVRAETTAPHQEAAFHNLQQGKYELLDIHHLLCVDDAELVLAHDFEGEVI